MNHMSVLFHQQLVHILIENFNMARKDIYSITKNIAIHCPTLLDSDRVRSIFDRYGLKWRDGDSYSTRSYWNKYNVDTCYCPIEGTFGRIEYFKKEKYKIITTEEFLKITEEL